MRLGRNRVLKRRDYEQEAGEAAMLSSVLLCKDTIPNAWRFYSEHEDGILADRADFMIDYTIFSMHLLDRLAFSMLKDREFFLNVLVAAVAAKLLDMGLLTVGDGVDQLVELCNARQGDWVGLELLSIGHDANPNSLFGTVSKRIILESNPVIESLLMGRFRTTWEQMINLLSDYVFELSLRQS